MKWSIKKSTNHSPERVRDSPNHNVQTIIEQDLHEQEQHFRGVNTQDGVRKRDTEGKEIERERRKSFWAKKGP